MRLVNVSITDASRIAEARRVSAAAGAAAGLSETAAGRLALVATEAATNVHRHAGRGEILIQPARNGSSPGVELLALDKGPGMRNIPQCLVDGYSTAGSSGTGLGAIRRLSDEFDIYSAPGKGTCIVVRVFARPTATAQRQEPPASGLEVGGVSVPKPGEQVCGDGWTARACGRATLVLVVDGLGHGLLAADASEKAVASFHEPDAPQDPVENLEWLSGSLRGTRGAAAAVARLEPVQRQVRFAGIGNIAAFVVSSDGTRQMISHSGIVGQQLRTVREFTYEWPRRALVVLYSDGLTSHCSLDPYPGLFDRDVSLIAAVLYRDFQRGRDDATVVVARDGDIRPGLVAT